MPSIDLAVPHQLSQDEVKSRVVSLIADARSRFAGEVNDLAESWSGYIDEFSFKARGFSVSGKLDVQPGQVKIQLHLPWAAFPFKHRIENDILTRARELLA